jgi:integrative and conjugative element protein (TIGR02256 family)
MTTADRNSASITVTSPGLRIDPKALDTATHLALTALPREAGGILVGWHEDTTVVVAGMLAVPDKRAGRRHYVRNHKHAQKLLDAHRQACGDDRVGYVGEWHSHPAPQPPSSVDYNALAELTRDTSEQVALVVLAVHIDNKVTPVGATAHRVGREVTITDVTIESRDHD